MTFDSSIVPTNDSGLHHHIHLLPPRYALHIAYLLSIMLTLRYAESLHNIESLYELSLVAFTIATLQVTVINNLN